MYTTSPHDAILERKVIDRLASSWDQRVAVRQDRLDLSQYCDDSIPDFPVALVPFWDDVNFSVLDSAAKLRFLGAAWIAYNEKAIYMEDEIVQPLCSLLLKNRLPGVGDPRVKQVLAQVQVDEQFHILMCLEICNNARMRHRLDTYVMPEPLLGLRMKARLAVAQDANEHALVRLAYAAVAETAIHAYLKQIASDTTIQPLNRINTDMHRRDESAHGTAFLEITRSVYKNLDQAGRVLFKTCLTEALNAYNEADPSLWSSILDHLQVGARTAIMDRLALTWASKRVSKDYTGLIGLLDELGIRDDINFTFD
jgi:hypothetical protein